MGHDSAMYEHHSERLLPARDFVIRMIRHGGLILMVLAVSLVAGIVGYHYLARMSWVDSFLNASMILGGMGPVGELPDATAKIFAGCYALYSGIILIVIAGIMIAPIAHRLLHKLHAEDVD
jgi:hypothetical protein